MMLCSNHEKHGQEAPAEYKYPVDAGQYIYLCPICATAFDLGLEIYPGDVIPESVWDTEEEDEDDEIL